MTSGVSFCFYSDTRLKLLTFISKLNTRRNKVKRKLRKEALNEKMFRCSKKYGVEVFTIKQEE